MPVENPQAIVERVLGYMSAELNTRVGVFLDRAAQTLHDQGHAESGGQASSRAAVRWLGENRAAIAAGIPQRMREAFLGRAPVRNISFDELQLLDDGALVNVIVRARIVVVMEKARLSAATLETRLDALQQAGARINPKSLAPGMVADEFVALLNELSVSKYVQTPLTEVYGLCGVEMLLDVYDDINRLLMQQGILPDYKTRIADDLIKTQAASIAPELAMSSGTAWDPVETPTSGLAAAPMTTDEKIVAMQQALASLVADDWRPGKLREIFQHSSTMVLTPEQERAIDPVEGVFLHLLRDASISRRFRAAMSRLIPSLLLLPPAEAAALSNAEHAVRRFMRQLTVLGVRDQQSPLQDFESIHVLIARITAEHAREMASFTQGADVLLAIAKNEVQRQLSARKSEAGAS